MCCNGFWKRVVVFYLTFGLGVLVANALVSKEIPAKNSTFCPMTKTELPVEERKTKAVNCVPVDRDLKYEKLSRVEDSSPNTTDEKKMADAEKQKDKKKSANNKSEDKAKMSAPPSGFYDPSKDPAEYKTLLHKEQCFESDGQK